MREHFCGAPAEMKPEIDKLFLAGINHIIYHGTAYSPADVPWPGWLFYASTQANPRNPLWRELTGVKKDGDRYAVYFNGKRIGTYSTREAAYFVWNAAAREWNDTHADPCDKYALYELSPEDTAKFESRDPRWRKPTGVKKNGDKYVVYFNGKRIGIYSTREAAYFVWNAAAREWNDTHADPFDKYALYELSPGDEAR